MSRLRSSSCLIALVLCAMLLSGCGAEGTHVDLMRYESTDDSFSILHSWTNINCNNKRDVKHVESLWQRRESIIVTPFTFLWSVPAVERLENKRFRWIDLTESTTDPEVVSEVDLDTIQVVPGPFYLNRHDNLCYVQQAVIPGKTMDAILVVVTPLLADQIAKIAEDDLRKSAMKRPSWNEVRETALQELDELAKVKTDGKKGSTPKDGTALDATSLDLLTKAKTANSIKLTRNRDLFSCVIPLSSADIREAIATFEVFRAKVEQYVQEGKAVEAGLPEGIQAVSLRSIDGTSLEISINFTKLAEARIIAGKGKLREEPKLGWKDAYESTVKSIQMRGVPVIPVFPIDEVLAKYFTE